ncbi:MAG: glutathione synthase [Candidatus Binatia bacterium]|nr:glutathione synthase [Candidatus Binatia bacterium]
MRVLFVLDPLEQLQLETETSLLLAAEFRRRGHETWFAIEDDVVLAGEGVFAFVRTLEVDALGRPQAGAPQRARLTDFQLILMRQDPPVDARYRFTAQALNAVASQVLVVNNPASVLTWNEKLLPLRFPQYAPPTLASHREEELLRFVQQHERVVVKPLSECSGRGIRIVDPTTAGEAIQATKSAYPGEPVVVQRYLPEVMQGDKRIFLANGLVVGAVNRIPTAPDRLANIHQGARVAATTLTKREQEIACVVGRFLQEEGIWLAGLDVIGGYLTEVNITSPSALRQINDVNGKRHETDVVDTLEQLVSNRLPKAQTMPT